MLVVLHLLTVVDRIDGSPAADESAGQAAETEDDSSSSLSQSLAFLPLTDRLLILLLLLN